MAQVSGIYANPKANITGGMNQGEQIFIDPSTGAPLINGMDAVTISDADRAAWAKLGGQNVFEQVNGQWWQTPGGHQSIENAIHPPQPEAAPTPAVSGLQAAAPTTPATNTSVQPAASQQQAPAAPTSSSGTNIYSQAIQALMNPTPTPTTAMPATMATPSGGGGYAGPSTDTTQKSPLQGLLQSQKRLLY